MMSGAWVRVPPSPPYCSVVQIVEHTSHKGAGEGASPFRATMPVWWKRADTIDSKPIASACRFDPCNRHHLCPLGEIGRHNEFKPRYPLWCTGSSPVEGTICEYDGSGIHTCLRNTVLQVQILLLAPFAELAQR